MTVFVHLGAPKTATTLLQNLLKANRAALEAQGVVNLRGPERHPFWYYWRNGDKAEFAARRAAFRRRFRAAARAFDHVIYSSETMFGASDLAGASRLFPRAETVANSLARMFRGMDVHLIFYVRRQDSYIESTFIHRFQTLPVRVKTDAEAARDIARWGRFEDYLASFDPACLDWDDLLMRLAGPFGRDRLTVRPFETIGAGRAAYARDFFAQFSNPDRLALGGEVFDNRSFSDPALKAYIKAIPDTPLLELRALRLALQARWPNTDYPRPHLLSAAQRTDILAACAPSNRRLFAKWIAPAHHPYAYSETD